MFVNVMIFNLYLIIITAAMAWCVTMSDTDHTTKKKRRSVDESYDQGNIQDKCL